MRNAREDLRRQKLDGAPKVSHEGGGGGAAGHRARSHGEADCRVSKNRLFPRSSTVATLPSQEYRSL